MKRTTPKELENVIGCLNDQSLGPQLRQAVQREVGMHTVALLPLSEPQRIDPGATGTLISFLDSHYILTAAHVWREGLKKALRVGITLKEDIDHKHLLDPKVISEFGPPKPAKWGEWGPDLVLLCIPPSIAAEVLAIGQVCFRNLSKPRPIQSGCYVEEWLLMGVPEAMANYQGAHADLYVNGFFLKDEPTTKRRKGFDYLDLDFAYAGAQEDFHGVSGGGLWRILYYNCEETGEVRFHKDLEGVAFFHLRGSKVVRCHGPRSIGTTLRFLFEPTRELR